MLTLLSLLFTSMFGAFGRQSFYGTDNFHILAVLLMQWLAADCGTDLLLHDMMTEMTVV